MSRISALFLAAALLAAPVSAFAETSAPTPVHEEAAKKYPMTAAEFRKHVAAREEKARDRMEAHIKRKELAKDKADEVRAKFNAALAKIDAKVEEVCADGSVTKDEAEEVRALTKSLLHHHKGAKHHKS